MSDLVLDASLALQWFLEDESGRQYGLSVLASLSSQRAVVPILWFYEVGNGLLMAHRRKRITFDQIDGFLTRLKALPIDAAQRKDGGPGRDRTDDLFHAMEARSQLRHRPTVWGTLRAVRCGRP